MARTGLGVVKVLPESRTHSGSATPVLSIKILLEKLFPSMVTSAGVGHWQNRTTQHGDW